MIEVSIPFSASNTYALEFNIEEILLSAVFKAVDVAVDTSSVEAIWRLLPQGVKSKISWEFAMEDGHPELCSTGFPPPQIPGLRKQEPLAVLCDEGHGVVKKIAEDANEEKYEDG